MMALKMLLVKVALSDIGFVLGVTEETTLMWLQRAAQKAHEINLHLLRDLPVTQVQRDEMWSFIRRKHAQQVGPDGESTELSEDGRQWVWIKSNVARNPLANAMGRQAKRSATPISSGPFPKQPSDASGIIRQGRNSWHDWRTNPARAKL